MLLDLSQLCYQQYKGSRGQGIGLEFLCNMGMDGKARSCIQYSCHHAVSAGKTVYVVVIKGQGFVKSNCSMASLQLFRDLCDLLNRQPQLPTSGPPLGQAHQWPVITQQSKAEQLNIKVDAWTACFDKL